MGIINSQIRGGAVISFCAGIEFYEGVYNRARLAQSIEHRSSACEQGESIFLPGELESLRGALRSPPV